MKVDIPVEIYSFDVVVTTTVDEHKATYKNASGDEKFITSAGDGFAYVLVSDEWGDIYHPKFMQCLTHELNHAAMHILGVSGVDFSFHSQEALCYLQDFLMRKFMDEAYKSNKK